jgi:hypothetical protein
VPCRSLHSRCNCDTRTRAKKAAPSIALALEFLRRRRRVCAPKTAVRWRVTTIAAALRFERKKA